MKLYIVASGIFALLTGGALAADLPTMKAPPAPMAPVAFTWTGFYFGASLGAAWGNSKVTDVDAYAASATPGTVTKTSSNGVIGGVQAGYNWQFGSFVAGLEGDFGGMGLEGNRLLTGTASGTRVGTNTAAYGDVTARLGLAADRALFYVKGGWAGMNDIPSFSTVTGSFSGRTQPGLSSGGVIGGGVEYAFQTNWTLKAEYLYFDFPDANYTVFTAGGAPFRFKQSEVVNSFKVGVNYRFE